MHILLDTVTLVWWLKDDKRLGKKARNILTDQNNQLFVSAFSVFEWRIKASIGKLTYYEDLEDKITENGFLLLDYTSTDSKYIDKFSNLSWSDPFDFGLMSQAIVRGMPFMTADRRILTDDIDNLKTIDARK